MAAVIGFDGLDSTMRLITALLIFVLVLAATYFVTRWIAGYQKGQMAKGNIEVMETCRLSQTKYIQIIRVGSRYLVIGVCKDTITMLASIEETDLNLEKNGISQEKQGSPETFQEVFQRIKEWNQKKEK